MIADARGERLAQIVARAQAALDGEGPREAEGFERRVAFDFGADGGFTVDGPARQVTLGAAALGLGAADAVVSLSLDDFVAVAKGERDAAMLFLRKRIRIEGLQAAALELVARMKAARV